MERAGVWSMRRGSAEAQGPSRAVAAVPDGFQQQLTYMAQPRVVDEPTVVNYGTFKGFQAEVWDRDMVDIAECRDEAIAFYDQRVGLDFSGSTVDPDDGTQTIEDDGNVIATLVPSFVAPETEYRPHTIGGRWTPPEGYVVRDSSFNVMLAPGTVLEGTYGGGDGKVAEGGGLLAFGDYSILIPGPGQSGDDETIDFRFRSTGPIVPNADGVMVFVCDPESDQWGSGQARGVVSPTGRSATS